MNKTTPQFYENNYPNIGDLVFTKVLQINDYGITVNLPEYQNIEAMIMVNEVSRRRTANLQKQYKLGSECICKVINVDSEKNFIDLSRKQVTEEEKINFIKKFKTNKKIVKITNKFAIENDLDYAELMKQTLWKFSNNNFMENLNNNNFIINHDNIKINEYLLNLKSNLLKKKSKVKSQFSIKCLLSEGIEYIKKILKKMDEVNDSEYNIKINLIKLPDFCLTCICDNTSKVIEIMNNMLKTAEEQVKSENNEMIKFEIITSPYVVDTTD